MSVGCLGTEQRAFKKRQWDVDLCICRWKELLEGWASICFQRLPHTHTHLTSSHHYRHHRLHLIKDFPPWLTPRQPALLKKERRGGKTNMTCVCRGFRFSATDWGNGAPDEKGRCKTRLGRVPGCNKGEKLQSLTVYMHYLSQWAQADRDVRWKMPCRNKFWSFQPSQFFRGGFASEMFGFCCIIYYIRCQGCSSDSGEQWVDGGIT